MEIRAKFRLPIIAISCLFAKQTAVSTTAKIFYIVSPCIFPMPGSKEHIYKVLHELKNTTWHAFCRHFLNTKERKVYIYDHWIVLFTLRAPIKCPFLGLSGDDLTNSVMIQSTSDWIWEIWLCSGF